MQSVSPAKKRTPFTPARGHTKALASVSNLPINDFTFNDAKDMKPFPSTSTSSSLASTSSGTSFAGSVNGTSTPKFTPSRSISPVKAPLSEISKTRGHTRFNSLQSTNPPNVNRPGSALGQSVRGYSPSPIPTTPKRNRNGYDSPYGSPTKPSMLNSFSFDQQELSSAHLIDAEGVTELDLSGEFDFNDISRAVGDERDRENDVFTEAGDKVLVSIRVKPAKGEDAWQLDKQEGKIVIKEQYARTSAGINNEFSFDNILTGSENKPIYEAAARKHVLSAMEGYHAVIFAYGQTASGKTFTLSGTDEQPGIIPKAMKDVFGYIKSTPEREYLLRASYLEIYNETIHDLLAPGVGVGKIPVALQGSGTNVTMTPLREEVVTSLKSIKDVIERGEGNRRTASTDWNERSSRSHSVFRLVIESRERTTARDGASTPIGVPQTPGGSRLHGQGSRGVRMSVLSLIDLAGSEKATSDKERTKEGKYINISLLNLGTVIGTLAENASKGKNDHVPFRNSKLTRMLQPSLMGDARISVICTLNPSPNAVGETLSTLQFASRVKKVALNATKKEIIDNEALIERYRKEIEELKEKLAEKDREQKQPRRGPRLSAQEVKAEERDKTDLNQRLKQLSKLILTSQTVSDGKDSRSASPSKLDFNLTPYELQEELLDAKRQVESLVSQNLALEAALASQPPATEDEKDKLNAELMKTNRELEIVVKGYESHLGEPLRGIREDVEREWSAKLETLQRELEKKEEWSKEVVRELERERQLRHKLEEEKRALISFVTDIDVHMKERSSTLNAYVRAQPPKLSFGVGRVFGSSVDQNSVRNNFGGGGLTGVKEVDEEKENVQHASV